MNNPELYISANDVQRHDADVVVKKFSSKMQWHPKGEDTLIDLGSGSGDVLMDIVYPRIPKNFQRIVCTDVNPTMISYARQKFGHVKGVEFETLDMATDTLPEQLKGQFDHVTSFYALMYARTQRQAIKNIWELLRPTGGDCLFITLCTHPIFHAYKVLSKMEKWAQYAIDVDSFIPPQQNCQEPRKQFMEFLTDAGFTDFSVELQHKTYDYRSVEVFKTNMMAVNPFVERMPATLRSEYMDEALVEAFKYMGNKIDPKDYCGVLQIPYTLLVVYSRK
uniref:Methyltransferase type 12 domain-containing protein n=1 Tax=Stomoxys calcitrans TaxID=35570 RepID=A0A1I8NP59_STOCA